jgi:hypothetical protein
MTAARELAVLRTYSDAVALLRRRRDELGVPQDVIDEVTGLTTGHTAKLLAPKTQKHIGAVSWNVFEALGIRLIAVEDLQALAKTMRNRHWRTRSPNNPGAASITASIAEALGRFTRKNAAEMARKRAASQTPEERARIARKAIRKRWRKPRVVEIANGEKHGQ